MDRLGALFNKIDSQKPLSKPKQKWPFLSRNKLSTGRFRVRFLSHDEKCPHGYHIWTVHEIQKELVENRWGLSMEEKEKAYYHYLCTESYKGTSESGKLISPCPICDVVEDVSQTYAEDRDEIDADVLNAIDEMSGNACRKFVYPVLVYASMTEVTNDDGKKKSLYVPDDRNVMGAVLILNAKNYENNPDLSLIRLIHQHAINADSEAHLSLRKGKWFTYEKKSNGQTLSPAESGGLSEKELEHYSNMPSIITFSMTKEGGTFAKHYALGYTAGMSYLRQCWAVKELVRSHGYDLDAVERGLV